ncbi:hypothetical protein PC121_g24326, partial [Phytophthora cactorum]
MCALGRRCGSLKVLGFFAACTVGNVHILYALLQISPANYADPMHCVNEVAADFQCMLPPPGAAEHPGRFDGSVEAKDGNLVVNGEVIHVFAARNPAEIPWGKAGAT